MSTTIKVTSVESRKEKEKVREYLRSSMSTVRGRQMRVGFKSPPPVPTPTVTPRGLEHSSVPKQSPRSPKNTSRRGASISFKRYPYGVAVKEVDGGTGHSQANRGSPSPEKKRPTSSAIKETLKRETFEDFAARIMTPLNDMETALGPEMHAALLSMANGIDLLPHQREEKRRQLQRKLRDGAAGLLVESTSKTDATEDQIDEPTKNFSVDNKLSPSFTSTFGGGLGRASIQDLETFQQRNKLWRSTLQQAVKYIRQNNYDPSQSEFVGRASEYTILPPMKPFIGNNELGGARTAAKVSAVVDLDRVIQRGSALLTASSDIRPKSTGKFNKESRPVEYIPPVRSFVEKIRPGSAKLPIYERIEAQKEKVLREGFPFDSFRDEIQKTIRSDSNKQRIIDRSSFPDSRIPFSGLKISSLVGRNVTALQGYRPSTPETKDAMNLFQLRLVQGLEDAQLSSFLENNARRRIPPIDFGMKIIRGRAPDPTSEFSQLMSSKRRGASNVNQIKKTKPIASRKQRSKSIGVPSDPYRLRAIPESMLNRVSEKLSSGKKLQELDVARSRTPPPKRIPTGSSFPHSGLSPAISPRLSRAVGNPKVSIANDLKTLSFKNVTKSEFMREMRKHEFPQMKSKDEMRKSFPKTYILKSIAKK